MSPPYYFHSGVNRPDLVSLLDEQHRWGWSTYMSSDNRDCRMRSHAIPRFPSSWISGFRHIIPVDRYVRLIEEYGHRFQWIASLDVLFDQRASDEHYSYLCSHLPSHALRAKVLWVYQGGSLYELRARARDAALIGIGGSVVRLVRQGVAATLHWLHQIGDVLMSVGTASAHIFGIGNKTMLTHLCHEPWVWGFDSSRWLLAYRARLQLLPSGASIRVLGSSKRDCAAKNIRVIERWINPFSDSASDERSFA